MDKIAEFMPLFFKGIGQMPWLLIFVIALIITAFVEAVDKKWEERKAK